MKFEQKTIDDILAHTKGNESDILHSNRCACLFCRQRYDARKVSDWSNEGNKISAVCPECGMPTVVGDASGYTFDHDELKELNERLFGIDFMEKHPENIRSYIQRYREFKISHKRVNEKLYIHYLELLADELYDADACFYLGQFYEFGSQFTEPDLFKAQIWYESPSLRFDGEALTRSGMIYKRFHEYNYAFQNFTKAVALGSSMGLIHLADCYLEGIYVYKDVNFGLKLLHNMFDEMYTRFIATGGNEAADFASLCYRLGKYYAKEGDPLAIKLFLCAQYAYSIVEENNHKLLGELASERNSTKRYLSKLSKEQGYEKGEPVLDLSTFLNSLNPFNEERGRYDLYIPCSLRNVYFSEEDKTLSFTTDSVYPFLVVDPQNLFCSFLNQNETNWVFENVTSFNGFNNGNILYNRVITNGNDQISFYNTFASGGPTLVGEIYLDTSKIDSEHSQEEMKKA